MRAINIEEMDFIAGGYDYGVDYDSDYADSSVTPDASLQTVLVTGTSTTWYEKIIADITSFFGNATATPATQAAHDLAVIREANPDCSVTQNIHINNGTASSTFSTSGANVSIQDTSSGETFTISCPPLNKQ